MIDLKVIMLGTGSPWPDLERSGPAQLLMINDLPILIDCGRGALEQIMRIGIPHESIDQLWLTHLHADHIFGYGEFLMGRWFKSRKKLTLVGPPGTKKFHEQTLEMYKDDIEYKLSLGRPKEGLLDTEIIEVEDSGPVYSDIPAEVTAEKMIHNVPTFAYRFQIGNKSVVFSGDTAPTEALVKLSKGADAIIHDCCLSPNDVYSGVVSKERQKIWGELQKEHCTPAQAAYTARAAGVKQLILTHFLPNSNSQLTLEEASEVFNGTTIVAKDLQVIEIV